MPAITEVFKNMKAMGPIRNAVSACTANHWKATAQAEAGHSRRSVPCTRRKGDRAGGCHQAGLLAGSGDFDCPYVRALTFAWPWQGMSLLKDRLR